MNLKGVLKIENPDNIYFTSDLHFNHTNIIKYCDRPFKNVSHMNEVLIQNWNKTVSSQDTVYVLGDFAYGTELEWNRLLQRLNGMKVLIMGNHDYHGSIPINKFHNIHEGFINVMIDKQLITLSHYPMLSWFQSHRGAWNLFGHWHNGLIRKIEGLEGSEDVKEYVNNEGIAYDKLRLTQYDVGVDGNNYTPIPYSVIKKIIETKTKKI